MSGVLVDTSIWSLALRRKNPRQVRVAQRLTQLIDDNQVKIIGAIRQELLSGYSDKNSYEKLRQKLTCFPNESTTDSDYEAAAEYSNMCRAKGVQGSHTDFLTCAVSIREEFPIYSSDRDFKQYAKHLPITLFEEN